MALVCRRLFGAIQVATLELIAPIDAVKQLRSRYTKRPRQLGNRPHALTLTTLDLRDMGHVEVRVVRKPFLTKPTLQSDAP